MHDCPDMNANLALDLFPSEMNEWLFYDNDGVRSNNSLQMHEFMAPLISYLGYQCSKSFPYFSESFR